MRALASTLLVLVLAAGCLPDVDVDESRIVAPRVLAIRAIPAEAAPGETVRLEALHVGPEGRIVDGVLEWARCDARRPLAELGPVSPACLAWEDPALVLLGFGASVEAAISRDACRLFGPDPPPAQPGEPAGRVVDPDVTGGYHQPVRVVSPDDAAIVLGEVRLSCGVAGATQAQAAELRQRRHANRAPEISTVFVQRGDGTDVLLDEATPLTVSRGESITMEAGWLECPESDACGDGICGADETSASCAEDCRVPSRCSGAERFVRFDPIARALVVERESMRVAWYTTDGRFELERTGRGADDPAPYASSRWIAPDAPGPVTVWMVIRDARGGVGWAERSLVVE